MKTTFSKIALIVVGVICFSAHAANTKDPSQTRLTFVGDGNVSTFSGPWASYGCTSPDSLSDIYGSYNTVNNLSCSEIMGSANVVNSGDVNVMGQNNQLANTYANVFGDNNNTKNGNINAFGSGITIDG